MPTVFPPKGYELPPPPPPQHAHTCRSQACFILPVNGEHHEVNASYSTPCSSLQAFAAAVSYEMLPPFIYSHKLHRPCTYSWPWEQCGLLTTQLHLQSATCTSCQIILRPIPICLQIHTSAPAPALALFVCGSPPPLSHACTLASMGQISNPCCARGFKGMPSASISFLPCWDQVLMPVPTPPPPPPPGARLPQSVQLILPPSGTADYCIRLMMSSSSLQLAILLENSAEPTAARQCGLLGNQCMYMRTQLVTGLITGQSLSHFALSSGLV